MGRDKSGGMNYLHVDDDNINDVLTVDALPMKIMLAYGLHVPYSYSYQDFI